MSATPRSGMVGPVPPPPPPYAPVPVADVPVARAMRFAVYLTGGLVTLAFGVLIVAEYTGEVLNCWAQTEGCSNGFNQAIYYETVPGLVGGAILVVVALVLFVLAHRER